MVQERSAKLSLRLPADMREALEDVCQKRGTTLTGTILTMLRRYLEGMAHQFPESEARAEKRRAIEAYSAVEIPKGKEARRRDALTRPERSYSPERPTQMRVAITIDAEERLAIRAVAEDLSMKDSELCTAVVRQWLGANPALSRDDRIDLRDLSRQVRRIGMNVNQIAHALNQIALKNEVYNDATLQELKASVLPLAEGIERVGNKLEIWFERERARWRMPEDDLMTMARHATLGR